MSKVVTIFESGISTVHMYKDVFLTGYYLAKNLGLDCELWSATEDDVTTHLRGAKLWNVKEKDRVAAINKRLAKEANDIAVLIMFHAKEINFKFTKTYKKFNKNAFVYIKLDYTPNLTMNKVPMGKNPIKNILRKVRYAKNIKAVNLYSVETSKSFEYLLKNKFFSKDISEKLILMPNGLDDENIAEAKAYGSKENLIITVGRIGTEQKNCEMLLAAIEEIDLKDWRVAFIGECTPEFTKLVESSSKKASIILPGIVLDRKALFDWYDRAKIFVLTSRFESYCLALNEALFFDNYIISTDVGIMTDFYNFGIGEKIEMDSMALAKSLQSVIDEKTNLTSNLAKQQELKQLFYSKHLIKRVADRYLQHTRKSRNE